ncbi:MAG: hypothetical protein AABX14_00900 [Candidatus Aenigmatarchaeota archaeon]
MLKEKSTPTIVPSVFMKFLPLPHAKSRMRSFLFSKNSTESFIGCVLYLSNSPAIFSQTSRWFMMNYPQK